jgi:hypothetical protein
MTIRIETMICAMGSMLACEMYYEVHDAHDERCEDECRNALYGNASTKEVKMICEDRQQIKNDRVYDDDAEAKGDNDDGSQDERKDRFQKKIEDGQDKADHDKLEEVCIQNKAWHVAVCEPQREGVAEDNEGDFE